MSLAIVWGTTIERACKFGAYLIYAVVFSALIYPIISHWIFGGGGGQPKMRAFAGSTVVRLTGATRALAPAAARPPERKVRRRR